jgi:predicted anti-sigma-YlaC factor YlaD
MWRRRRTIVCREAVEVVTDYLEGAMAPGDRARFEAHLAECPHCREYLAQMRTTLDVLGRIDPDTLAPDARDELVALYRRWRAG